MLTIDLLFILLEEGMVEIHLSTGPSSHSAGCVCIHLFVHEIDCVNEPMCACVCVCMSVQVCNLCRQRLTSEHEPPLTPSFSAISVPLE